MAVQMSNVDVGARTIEVNKVEYIIRGLGFIKNLTDIENSVIKVNDNVPIYIKNIATVSLGPALRRGALDKGGDRSCRWSCSCSLRRKSIGCNKKHKKNDCVKFPLVYLKKSLSTTDKSGNKR